MEITSLSNSSLYIVTWNQPLIKDWVQVILHVTLNHVTSFNIFLLDTNFNKSTIGLNFLFVFFMFVKFQDDLRWITMLLIKYLNFKFFFYIYKIVHKIWVSRSNSN